LHPLRRELSPPILNAALPCSVAPRARDRLLASAGNLELDGVKLMVAILFADLEGFTSYSEKREPETTFSVLNQYLALAAQAALKIMERTASPQYNVKDCERQLSFRIGVATGLAVVGNVGTGELFNYTAIGDPVNLAFRLRSSAQSNQILLSKSTYDVIADHGQRARAGG